MNAFFVGAPSRARIFGLLSRLKAAPTALRSGAIGAPSGARIFALLAVFAATAAAAKPVAPIGIDYAFAAEPVLGAPLEIELTISGRTPMDDVVVDVTGDAGLFVAPADAETRIARITPDAPYTFAITVTPLEAAQLRLGVSVDARIGGARQARSRVIVIRLGAAKSPDKTQAVLKTTPSGDTVRSLPAEDR
jgi:hypothetical protein